MCSKEQQPVAEGAYSCLQSWLNAVGLWGQMRGLPEAPPPTPTISLNLTGRVY